MYYLSISQVFEGFSNGFLPYTTYGFYFQRGIDKEVYKLDHIIILQKYAI